MPLDTAGPCPPEPPDGTWVKDRHGGVHHRKGDGWGQPGCYYFGRWAAMWEARGPLVECGPWGDALPAGVTITSTVIHEDGSKTVTTTTHPGKRLVLTDDPAMPLTLIDIDKD